MKMKDKMSRPMMMRRPVMVKTDKQDEVSFGGFCEEISNVGVETKASRDLG